MADLLRTGWRKVHHAQHELVAVEGGDHRYKTDILETCDGYLFETLFHHQESGRYCILASWMDPKDLKGQPLEELIALQDYQARLWLVYHPPPAEPPTIPAKPAPRRCPVALRGARHPVIVSGHPLLTEKGNRFLPTPELFSVFEALVKDCCEWGEGLTTQDMVDATGGRLDHPHKVLWRLRRRNDRWAAVYVAVTPGFPNHPGRYGIRPACPQPVP